MFRTGLIPLETILSTSEIIARKPSPRLNKDDELPYFQNLFKDLGETKENSLDNINKILADNPDFTEKVGRTMTNIDIQSHVQYQLLKSFA